MTNEEISRQGAIEKLECFCMEKALEDQNHPSAQRKGKWEMKPDPYGFVDEIPVCSECGCTTKMREKTKHCPNCGADMRPDNAPLADDDSIYG